MPPDARGITEYQNARKAARRYLAEHQDDVSRGHLIVLDEIVGRDAGEIALGCHEIPLKKVIGTFTSARAEAFSGNFMPLMDESSEFAYKWRTLFSHHITDGISDPIKVYEYLGLFYVIEGNKRVSVMKYVGAYSIRAEVIRLLPGRHAALPDEDGGRPDRLCSRADEIKIYYEFIDYDPRSFAWNDMWFSRPGSFTSLIENATEFAQTELEGKRPEEWLPRAYADFALQYDRAGFKNLGMTTGDAFLIYVMVYGFPHETPTDLLRERVAACEAQFRRASGEGAVITIEEGQQPSVSVGRGILFGIGEKRAKALFCYARPPEGSAWTRAHEAARLYATKYFEGRAETSSLFGIDPQDAYASISAAILEQRPDILFTVHSQFAPDTLKIALENPDMLVFNCNHINPYLELNTYFSKLYEQTFLLGAIAGAFSKNGTVGFCDVPSHATGSTYAVGAFAQGARLTSHSVKVLRFTPRVNYDIGEDRLSRRLLAAAGCDVIFCQYPVYNTPISKPDDNIYGMLVSCDAEGRVLDYLAAAAWDWSAHYTRIIGGYLDGTFAPLAKSRAGGGAGSLYFWLGIASGAAPIYRAEEVLGPDTSRLATVLQELVEKSVLHPFCGPILDSEGKLRVARSDMPSLADIQTMDWIPDNVSQIEAEG